MDALGGPLIAFGILAHLTTTSAYDAIFVLSFALAGTGVAIVPDLRPGAAPAEAAAEKPERVRRKGALRRAGWPAVRLSFDDGNASDVEIGLPGLLERGLTATFFPLAGRLDTPAASAADLTALPGQGMTVGTHGMWHVPWRGLPPAERDAELVEARERLAKVAGRPVDEAALPLGRYDRRLLADLRGLGYTRVYTSDRRHAAEGAWLQPRFSVTGGDTPESLRATVLRAPSLPRRAALPAVGPVKRLR